MADETVEDRSLLLLETLHMGIVISWWHRWELL